MAWRSAGADLRRCACLLLLRLMLGLLLRRVSAGWLRLIAASLAAFGGDQDYPNLTAGGLKLKDDRSVDGRR